MSCGKLVPFAFGLCLRLDFSGVWHGRPPLSVRVWCPALHKHNQAAQDQCSSLLGVMLVTSCWETRSPGLLLLHPLRCARCAKCARCARCVPWNCCIPRGVQGVFLGLATGQSLPCSAAQA